MKNNEKKAQGIVAFAMILFLVIGCTACSSSTSREARNFDDEIIIEKDALNSLVIFDRDNAEKTDAGNFAFQNVSPSFGAASDVAYTIDNKTGMFSFVITWVDAGNPLYVGLLSEENKAYLTSLEGGTATCSIDISSLPEGKYNVIVVHQGKYDPTITGAISYHFSHD